MLTTIEGYRSHNKALYLELGCAAEFYADKLLGKRMAKNILVEIKLTKELKQKEQAYGYCHITDDNLNRPREFMIELDTSMKHPFDQILIWLAHEMVHAAVGVQHGHKWPFRTLALAIGLTSKMTATEESEAFKQRLAPILAELGDYPHAKLDASNRKKQTTRLIKTECPRCGYTARKWLDVGAPICPTDNVQMV